MNVSTFINKQAITSKSLHETLLHQMYKIKTTTLLVGTIDNKFPLPLQALERRARGTASEASRTA